MGNKNCRGNRALARPSAASKEAASALEFDLRLLPSHPALTIVDNESISIHIEQCTGMRDHPTDMSTLIETLAAYAPYVKHIQLKIHAPYPHRESWDAQKTRTQLFKKLFVQIDNFKLVSLNLLMLLNAEKFPQMKLAAGITGLKFKGWKLMYEVFQIGTSRIVG
ncbi:hypothetical protein SBOR_9058 [Sclerotinia borealis F-4128]|uniref:Uncharacterized protein n=1 Tax=Sclerotinia borealis (strain F-4128) TaxID=1432307 RepID=W9C3U0_SCLBF|nr:hypothetical protein SBOR_9058 [Sclerotinia borealis F-4128]